MAADAYVKFIFFGLLLLAVALEVIGDVYFKKWSMEGRNILLYLGLAIYFLGSVFWAISLKYELLSKAISIFTVLNLIIVVLIGTIMFNESLSTINKLGIALGVLSVILIEI